MCPLKYREYGKNRGYTLVEVLVTVAIIALVGSLAIPTFKKYSAKSKRNECLTMLSSLRVLQGSYVADFSETFNTAFCPKSAGMHTLVSGSGVTKNVLTLPESDSLMYCDTISGIKAPNPADGVDGFDRFRIANFKTAYSYRYYARSWDHDNAEAGWTNEAGLNMPTFSASTNSYGYTIAAPPAGWDLTGCSLEGLPVAGTKDYHIECWGNIDSDFGGAGNIYYDRVVMDHMGSTCVTNDDVKNNP